MYSQRDPAWSEEILGTDQVTIGQAGCLLTCVAQMLAGWGVGTDPSRLNQWLIKSQGYVDDNLFLFSAVELFGAKLLEVVFCETTAAPIGSIEAHLGHDDRAVILLVDAIPGGTLQSHWVRLWDLPLAHIVDPWRLPNDKPVRLSTYYTPGWTPARAIMGYAAYAHDAKAPRAVAHNGFAGAAQRWLAFFPLGERLGLAPDTQGFTAGPPAPCQGQEPDDVSGRVPYQVDGQAHAEPEPAEQVEQDQPQQQVAEQQLGNLPAVDSGARRGRFRRRQAIVAREGRVQRQGHALAPHRLVEVDELELVGHPPALPYQVGHGVTLTDL